ncbi:MAG: hypothetical protein E5Y10_24540 [Mesorhizobium sp.]|nr:MAG: hypothetical protein E5Y10_24540 [Mesorhizobium sp.]
MKHTIATLDGVFVRNPKTGLYDPYDTSTPYPCRLCIWIAAAAVSWAAAIGAGYALHQAWQALT